MNFTKISLTLIALALAFTIVSCDSEKNEKEETSDTKQDEVREEAKDQVATTATTTLPAGEITLDRLPASVKEFVTKNHPGYAMIRAVSDPLCQGGDAIDVAITKSGSPSFSLIFTPDGSFVQQEEDVPLTTAPDKIRDVLKLKFADYSAGNQIEKLVLTDKSIQYLVDLVKGKITKEVIFKTDGTVVCEK